MNERRRFQPKKKEKKEKQGDTVRPVFPGDPEYPVQPGEDIVHTPHKPEVGDYNPDFDGVEIPQPQPETEDRRERIQPEIQFQQVNDHNTQNIIKEENNEE